MKENSDDGLKRKRGRTANTHTVRLLMNLMVVQILLYGLPEALCQLAAPLVALVSAVIPTIAVYAANSPSPARVGLIFTAQWILCPLYVMSIYYLHGRHIKPTEMLPTGRGLLWLLCCLVLLISPALLPQKIDLDPRWFRPNHIWDSWMHDMLWPNGVLAIIYPLISSLMLPLIFSTFKATYPFSIYFYGKKS